MAGRPPTAGGAGAGPIPSSRATTKQGGRAAGQKSQQPRACAQAPSPSAPRPPPLTSSSTPHLQPLPTDKFFETFSYLPALSDSEVAKQVDYITRNGWVPGLEFADAEHAYVGDASAPRIVNTVGYQDNRYWTMYKLPMFGCTDSSQVLTEIASAVKSFPKAYIRLVAFDADKQVQVAGMLVHRPSYDDVCKPEERSV